MIFSRTVPLRLSRTYRDYQPQLRKDFLVVAQLRLIASKGEHPQVKANTRFALTGIACRARTLCSPSDSYEPLPIDDPSLTAEDRTEFHEQMRRDILFVSPHPFDRTHKKQPLRSF